MTDSTGFLDVDQNSHAPFVNDPIEHIRWNTTTPPAAQYKVFVHGFQLRGEDLASATGVPFILEVKTPQGLRSYSGFARQGQMAEIDTLAIGVSLDDDMSQEDNNPLMVKDDKTASNLLARAKAKLQGNDRQSKAMGRSMLRNLKRNYPMSSTAREAEMLLKVE